MTPRIAKGETPRRAFRIEPALWSAATELAASNNETVSDVVRRALESYVKKGKK